MTRRRGGVLLEVLVSVALFVGAAAFALGATRSVLAGLDLVRREQVAVDLARSMLAQLEAGVINLADLREASWSQRPFEAFAERGFDGRGGDEGVRWSAEVETSQSEFRGLTLVSLTVHEAASEFAGDDERGVEVTIRQLVRLTPFQEEPPESDPMLEGLEGLEGLDGTDGPVEASP